MSQRRKTWTVLLAQLRLNLDEPTASFWTDAELMGYTNRAKDRVQAEVRKLKADYFDLQRTSADGTVTIVGESYATSGFAIVAGTRNYTLPPDILEMKLIECITTNYEQVRFVFADLTKAEHRAVREITTNQSPSRFLVWLFGERTMTIAPLSDTALDLRLTYTPMIPDLSTGSDTLEMPHPLYIAVEAYATSTALKKDRATEAAVWEATGNTIIAGLFGGHARQTQDPQYVESYMSEILGW